MASKITSPRTFALVGAHTTARDLDETRARVVDLKRQIAEHDATRAKVGSAASDLDRQAHAILGAHSERSAQAIIAGKQPPPMSREDAEIVRKARQVASSTPVALEKLQRDGLALSAQLSDAQAAFAGAVFNYVRECQRRAQDRITAALAGLAPHLVELLALNEVQRRYCGAERTLKLKPGEAPPWSGDVVVKNFTDRLPLVFKPPAVELLKLTEQSATQFKEIMAKIDGGN